MEKLRSHPPAEGSLIKCWLKYFDKDRSGKVAETHSGVHKILRDALESVSGTSVASETEKCTVESITYYFDPVSLSSF